MSFKFLHPSSPKIGVLIWFDLIFFIKSNVTPLVCTDFVTLKIRKWHKNALYNTACHHSYILKYSVFISTIRCFGDISETAVLLDYRLNIISLSYSLYFTFNISLSTVRPWLLQDVWNCKCYIVKQVSPETHIFNLFSSFCL